MTKMKWASARQRSRVAQERRKVFHPLPTVRNAPLNRVPVRSYAAGERTTTEARDAEQPFGVSYIRVADDVVGVGLSTGCAPDFVCTDSRSAIVLLDELRDELANDNYAVSAKAA